MNNWIEQLYPIIEEFAGGRQALKEDSLDGDEIESLCNIIKLKIRLYQGNITQDKYEMAMDNPNHIDLAVDVESESNGFGHSKVFIGTIEGNPNKFQDELMDIYAERYLLHDLDADCFWIKINIYNNKEVNILKSFNVITNIKAFKRANYDFVMLLVDDDSAFRKEQ